ncbi:MAG TPA: hypothetical protein VF180_13795 [Acidimicrobiia bacterium]
MTHFEVDLDLLSRTARDLRAAVGLARTVADNRGSLAALLADCGSSRLASAGEDFLGEWGYGMKLIVDDGEQLAQMLEAGAARYGEVEDRISRGLQ